MRRVGLFMLALIFCGYACSMSRIRKDFTEAQRAEGMELIKGEVFSKLDEVITYFRAKRFRNSGIFRSNWNLLNKSFPKVSEFLQQRMNDRATDPDVNSELIYLSFGYLTAIDEIKKDDDVKKKISEL